MVEGNNSAGKRAAQAAACPPRMATAICQGVKQQMEIDSAAALAKGHLESSYPVNDEAVTEPPAKRARRGAKLLGGTGRTQATSYTTRRLDEHVQGEG